MHTFPAGKVTTAADAAPVQQLGLRERKKRRTRQALIDAALRLYQERGLDGVTVAEITRIADVAPRTFFAYFESKEDVFLGRGDERVELLIEAIRARDRGEPILLAARRALRQGREPRRDRSPTSAPQLAELLRTLPSQADCGCAGTAGRTCLRRRSLPMSAPTQAIPRHESWRPRSPQTIRVAATATEELPGRRAEIAERVFDLLASGLARYGDGLSGS